MRGTCCRRLCSAKETAPAGRRLLRGALGFPGSALAGRCCLPPSLLRALLSLDRHLQGSTATDDACSYSSLWRAQQTWLAAAPLHQILLSGSYGSRGQQAHMTYPWGCRAACPL